MPSYYLPDNLSLLTERYPGWGALMQKATDTMLTSKDVGRVLQLSYRQLTDWDKRGMLKSIFERPMSERTEGWRRFSVLDLLCLGVLKEAKRQGISITRLQSFMNLIFPIGGLLYEAIPYIVYGFDVYLYSNLDDWIFMRPSDPTGKRFELATEDLKESALVVILPLNRIVEELLEKLDLPDFCAVRRPEGGYRFIINGVPLALEQLPDQEEPTEQR